MSRNDAVRQHGGRTRARKGSTQPLFEPARVIIRPRRSAPPSRGAEAGPEEESSVEAREYRETQAIERAMQSKSFEESA
ncbi:hypothetical protein DAT35_52790 [Vitiosangium sp. GDMCC 1.1324]|nr:hypothetical protein DAT35_52790 [Vitiosangium sp. GDMCC 1.1324]